MKYDREVHKRHSIRLKDYDYTQAGMYFVTVCSKYRECLFGDIFDGEMRTNRYGNIVLKCWQNLVHGIIILTDVGAGLKPAPTINNTTNELHGLPEILRAFKTFSSRGVNDVRNTPGVPVWQRNYYDHIIRNDKELDHIREYITTNPLTWDKDEENKDANGIIR